jgi:NADH:ubiquinone oxidoreductase subunit 5 (subunit L)/multisubunit Na+/H+ antiporter MnhA subunit
MEWIEAGDLKIDIAFRLDHLSSLMTLVVTGVGGLIHLFSIGYMRRTTATRYFSVPQPVHRVHAGAGPGSSMP